MRLITSKVCAQLFCISLLPLFVSTSHGQTPMQNIKNRDDAIERDARNSGRRKSGLDLNTALLLKSLKDDFRQLQIVNNELMTRTITRSPKNPAPISYKEIDSSLGEIQKRARRLLLNLKLPEVKKQKDEETESALSKVTTVTLSSGLLKLDQKVMDFVQNPMFQQPRVLDTKMSISAAQDLKEILRLTDMLRKETSRDQNLVYLND